MALVLNNAHFKEVLGSPTFKNYDLKKRNQVATLSHVTHVKKESSPPKKKIRITENYFKKWIQHMNQIYDNIYSNSNDDYNIYSNKNITIHDMFHLFLIQMNFESKKVLNVDLYLSLKFGTTITNLDIISRKKYKMNKKLINELIPMINTNYKDSNNDFIESSNCEIYIDKRNNILYKQFDIFSLLDMVQEAFIQKILYSYLPNNIAQVYGIYKTSNKSVDYILSQTYFEDTTLFNNYESFNKKQLLNILISVCNQLSLLQKEVQFLHNDLKINNVCVNIQKEEACFIDFGYSSLVCNNHLIHGYFELELNEFNLHKYFKSYTENVVMTHETVINDKYRNSADLFYLIYTILYYNHSQFKNPLYDILYDLFNVNDPVKGTINIFNILYVLEHNGFNHATFFMTKSHKIFNEYFSRYFGYTIENIDLFYEKFLPENLSTYLASFIETN